MMILLFYQFFTESITMTTPQIQPIEVKPQPQDDLIYSCACIHCCKISLTLINFTLIVIINLLRSPPLSSIVTVLVLVHLISA